VRTILLLALGPLILGAQARSVTWTGWFADDKCVSGRVAASNLGPNNPECAKTCIEKGATPVFISEQAKAMFAVKNYPGVVADLGYHLEITATVDEAAHTISIQKVNRLSYEGASCARPKKPASK
jgi:hypothetical protein